MLPSDLLEHKIYQAAAVVDRSQGRSLSWGNLSLELGHPEDAMLLRLLKDLSERGLLEVKKWVNGGGGHTYPNTTLNDEEFFFRRDFRLFLTSAGERRYEELGRQYKAEEHIDKALAREQNHFERLVADVQNDVQTELRNIPFANVATGQYAKLIVDAHIKGP